MDDLFLTIPTPIGKLTLHAKDKKIIRVSKCIRKNDSDHPLMLKAGRELAEYFQGTREKFTFPIELSGTEFQLKVWSELRKIPYGDTTNYQQIARQINSPNASQAVGNAINKNPLPIVIACHRVIGKNGKLSGFAWGADIKQKLLTLEAQDR